MAFLRPLVVAFLLFAGALGPAAAADMFGRPEAPRAQADAPVAPPSALAPAPAAGASLPAPLRDLLGRSLAIQSRLNGELRAQLQLAKQGRSLRPAFIIVLLSFLYGVFHAVGPGHGKVVVGSYFLTRRARLLHGLAMSGAAALVQAVSAVVLVGLLAAVLDLGSREILAQAASLETFSYGVIVALGLWMGWGVITRRSCCDHAEDEDHHAGCDHAHHSEHHHHHHHTVGHADEHADEGGRARRSELAKVLATGAAVGLRPCSGAILVLLFTLANQIFPIGIVATFAMGLGVAITVSVVSLTTLGVHRSLTSLGEHRRALAERLRQGAALAGAAFITLFGVLQLVGIWTGIITPMAG